MNQEKIGQMIKDIRKKNNLTQAELAESLGVTFQAVSKWENGKNIPDIEIIKQICQKYNIDINELLDNKVKPKKKIIIPIIVISLIVLGILGGLYLINRDSFQMRRIITNNSDFKISGSVAYDKQGKTYIYINKIEYNNEEDNEVYKNIKVSLYEFYKNKSTKIKDCECEEENVTIKEHLENVTFNVDDYKSSCSDLTKSHLYLEIETKNQDDKVTYYRVPLELEELCPEK